MNDFSKLLFKFRLYSRIHREPFQLPASPRCLIFLSADYGNLGDVAITYAQKKLLKQCFPNHSVIEVPANKSLSVLSSIKSQIHPDDVITVVGGGNMGDMYADLEIIRMLVVKTFVHNRMILFPQTIDYSNTKQVIWLLRHSNEIYSSHPRLVMLAREKVSYQFMLQHYPKVEVRLTPDIVMSLDMRKNSKRGKIVLLCLRDDKEKLDNSKLIAKILDCCYQKSLKIEISDTHIGEGRFSENVKYSILNKLWDSFRRSSLVVTDRLHGMIFAFITGTPALVMPNSNFKVKECYQWIREVSYIKFMEDGVPVSEAINEVLNAVDGYKELALRNRLASILKQEILRE